MNKDILQGKWFEIKGRVKEKWGKLTDDDLTVINGKKEALIGKLQKRYGYARDRAEQELNEFEKFHEQEERETESTGPSDTFKKHR